MSLFRKQAPKACPKCGKTDGWHAVHDNSPQDAVTDSRAVNPFSSAPIRNTFGQNLTGGSGRRAGIRYRCDSCGYEKVY